MLRRRSQRVGSVAGRDKCPGNGRPAGATLRIGRPLAGRGPIHPGHGRRPFSVRPGPAAPGSRESPGDLQRRVPHLERAHDRARTGGGRIVGAGADAPGGQRGAPPGAHLDLVAPRFVGAIAVGASRVGLGPLRAVARRTRPGVAAGGARSSSRVARSHAGRRRSAPGRARLRRPGAPPRACRDRPGRSPGDRGHRALVPPAGQGP